VICDIGSVLSELTRGRLGPLETDRSGCAQFEFFRLVHESPTRCISLV